MHVAVVVVNYNSGRHLKNCLASLGRCNGSTRDFSVYIYDNGSTDNSVNTAQHAFPQMHFIRGHTNVGFAQAANRVIRKIQSRYIVLVNPDVVVLPGTIENMAGFMDNHPECGILGGEIISPVGYSQHTCRRFPDYRNVLFGRRSVMRRLLPNNTGSRTYLYLDLDTSRPQQVDFVEGSLMLVRRKALEDTGLFDERYFLYVEDADLCYRMKQRGWQTWWLPQTYAIHFRGETFRQDNVHPAMHHSRGFYRFFTRHYRPGRLVTLAIRALLALRLMYIVVFESIKGVFHDISFSPRQ
jgi:N-acetylglucosaminyl-diphospho-decaprenol L-rhamnosyltransferase